jgi:hypothetical protein
MDPRRAGSFIEVNRTPESPVSPPATLSVTGTGIGIDADTHSART